MNPTKETILQITAPATPIFACYHEGPDPKQYPTPEQLWLSPCPVVALMQDERGAHYVMPLILEQKGLMEPQADNFFGFASSREEANQLYSSEAVRTDGKRTAPCPFRVIP